MLQYLIWLACIHSTTLGQPNPACVSNLTLSLSVSEVKDDWKVSGSEKLLRACLIWRF